MAQIPRIASRQNPVVDAFRRLARGPSEDGRVLLDGAHLVDEALRARVRLDVVLASDPDDSLLQRARAAGATIYAISRPALEAASPVRTPSGVVATAEWRPAPLESVWSASPALVLGLIDVQDPGNLGAIIRSADAFGASGVVTTPGGADPGGWKALRGAMGSTFRVPVARAPIAQAVAEARRRGFRIAATTSGAGQSIETISLVEPVFLLLGNEGAGLPPDAMSSVDMSISVPMRDGANSLNVGATAAVVLYEARRQRQVRTRSA